MRILTITLRSGTVTPVWIGVLDGMTLTLLNLANASGPPLNIAWVRHALAGIPENQARMPPMNPQQGSHPLQPLPQMPQLPKRPHLRNLPPARNPHLLALSVHQSPERNLPHLPRHVHRPPALGEAQTAHRENAPLTLIPRQGQRTPPTGPTSILLVLSESFAQEPMLSNG